MGSDRIGKWVRITHTQVVAGRASNRWWCRSRRRLDVEIASQFNEGGRFEFFHVVVATKTDLKLFLECYLESAKLFSGGSSPLHQLDLGHAPMTDSPCVFLKLDRTPEAKPLSHCPKLPARAQKDS